MKKQLPLEGIRVIEFSHMVMGPTAGLVLADLGAEVIKVEPEGKGDPTRHLKSTGAGFFASFSRNKKSVTLDLATPAAPRVVGELKLLGYSAYLHPISDDLVIGIGQDVDAAGHPLGTHVSLFDVSDLKHPKLLQSAPLGQGWSEAESDPHALLYWPKTSLLVVPFNDRAQGFRIGRTSGIVQIGSVVHDAAGQPGYTPQIHRSLVAGDSLFTVSDAGVKSSSLNALVDQGWAAFPPQAAPTPTPLPAVPPTG